MAKVIFLFSFLFLSIITEAQLPGNSLRIMADGNYISIPDASSTSLNNDMTIEAMIYYRCENGTTNNTYISKGWCGSTWSYQVGIWNRKIRFSKWKNLAWSTTNCSSYSNVVYETDSQEVAFHTWTHIAVSISGTTVIFYVDGQPVSSSLTSGTDAPGFKTSTEPIRLGVSRSLSGALPAIQANIDEVRIWHTARTQAEIQNNMNTELTGNESGLFAYWKLNETGSGAGISVLNSATATSGMFNGTTVGSAASLLFNDNATIPNELPTCDPVLWLKADAGVTYNGSNQVSQWSDQSGLNHHVTQTNLANMPIYHSNVINNKPAIYFDGSSGKYFLNNTSVNLVNGGAARTVFVSGKRDCKTHSSGVIGGTLFTFRRSGLINTLTFGANSAGSPVYIYSDNNGVGNNNASIAFDALDTAIRNFVVSYKVPNAGSQIQCRLNKADKIVDQGVGSVIAETGTTGFTVGDREDQVDLDWSGWMNEVIVFNRAMTNKEIISIENYLKSKYPQTPTIFNATYSSAQNFNNNIMDDGHWAHTYNSAEMNKIIASIKHSCLDLGTRTDTVYVETNPVLIGTTYAMRRHFTINTTLNPLGAKRIRLYYTNADFVNLQTMLPSLASHNQLVVTKYNGTNEDGIYNTGGGAVTFIPSSQITTGTAFGQRYLEFDVTGFSEFWIHTGSVALPVALNSFVVNNCNAKACLQWAVGEERNVSLYEIEKSTDAISFEPIGKVNALHKSKYTFTDEHPFVGKNYYRIKILDIDGKFVYSNINEIIFEEGKWNVQVLPTYNENGLFNLNSNISIQEAIVYNMNGSIIKTIKNPTNTLDISNLSSGMYMLKVSTHKESKILKLMK